MKSDDPNKTDQNPAATDPGEVRELENLRYIGYRGGFIFKHRAMFTLPSNLSKTASSTILSLVLFVGWLVALKWVTLAWAHILDFWRDALGLGGYVTLSHYNFLDFYRFTVPYLHVSAGPPDYVTLCVGGLVTLLFVILTFFIPKRYLPLIYLIRVVAFFHACAQVFFAFVPVSFPYGASGYIHGVLIAGLALITLMPIILGFTFYVFDFSLIRKITLSLIIILYLSLLIPLQYMAHAYVMHHLSLLFLPVLFFVFGLPLNVMIFMALYSWGASWKDSLHRNEFGREA